MLPAHRTAGEGRVGQYGKRLPPYKETMLYEPTVLSHAEGLRSSEAPPPTDDRTMKDRP